MNAMDIPQYDSIPEGMCTLETAAKRFGIKAFGMSHYVIAHGIRCIGKCGHFKLFPLADIEEARATPYRNRPGRKPHQPSGDTKPIRLMPVTGEDSMKDVDIAMELGVSVEMVRRWCLNRTGEYLDGKAVRCYHSLADARDYYHACVCRHKKGKQSNKVVTR